MKRIILAVVTSVVALSMAILTTTATWSDTVTVSNNQVITGTADLQVSSVGTSGPWNTSTATSTLTLSNLIPGGSAGNGFSFALWNNSTTGVDFNTLGQMTSVSISGTGSPDQSKLEVAVYPDGATPDTGSGWITLANWQSTARSFNSVLNPGIPDAKNYNISARLISSAENEWQGRTVTFTLTVNGQQP